MTTANTTGTGSRQPDPPERNPEDMTGFDHLTRDGNTYWLAQHLGRSESTIVQG